MLTDELEQLTNTQLLEMMTIINENICLIIQRRCLANGTVLPQAKDLH